MGEGGQEAPSVMTLPGFMPTVLPVVTDPPRKELLNRHNRRAIPFGNSAKLAAAQESCTEQGHTDSEQTDMRSHRIGGPAESGHAGHPGGHRTGAERREH